MFLSLLQQWSDTIIILKQFWNSSSVLKSRSTLEFCVNGFLLQNHLFIYLTVTF